MTRTERSGPPQAAPITTHLPPSISVGADGWVRVAIDADRRAGWTVYAWRRIEAVNRAA